MSTLVTSNIKHSGSASNNVELDSSGNLKFNSGYGSAAVSYGCRAWVNFNGTGTVAIRSSGNVSSITDNGTGDYTVNFTTAMVDRNYAALVSGNYGSGIGVFADPNAAFLPYGATPTASAIRLGTRSSGSFFDYEEIYVAIFR